MTWLRTVDEAQLSDEVREAFATYREKLGFLPNVHRIFALRPTHYLRWLRYYEELLRGPSGLSVVEREMIAVAVSAANDCHYCSTSHGAYLRVLSGDPALADRLAADYTALPLNERQRAMLDFALKVTKDAHGCTEEDVQHLREVGFTDEDIFDIAEVAAMFNLTNRLTSALGMQPNPEFGAMGR